MSLSEKYFKNMKLVIEKKLIPIMLDNQLGNATTRYTSTTKNEREILLLLLYYDTEFEKKLTSIENILFGVEKAHLELLEQRYACKYNIPLKDIYEKTLQDVLSAIENRKSSLYELYAGLTNYNPLHPITSIVDKLKTANVQDLFVDIISSNSFQNLIKGLDNFINGLINNIKNKSDILCSSTLLGYIYRYVNSIYPYLTDSENPVRSYIEGAIFHINQTIKQEYNYSIIESLLGNLSYLPISGYLFYTNYYAYIFSKCIVKKEDIDKELKKFVEENKCIFQGQSINCSNNFAMDLLSKFLTKKDSTLKVALNNIDRTIPDIVKVTREEKNIILTSPLPQVRGSDRIHINSGIIRKWLYKEGDKIEGGSSTIAHITDVDTNAITALAVSDSGILSRIIKKEGEVIKVGDPIAQMYIEVYLKNDIPIGEKFQDVCSLVKSCPQTSIPSIVCSSIKEYLDKQHTFCPDELKECKNTARGNLCYINSEVCQENGDDPPYCLSTEKCTDDTCRKFITNEINALFRNNIPRKEQFCKILKNDIYNCCSKLNEYMNLTGTVLEVCNKGYYRVDSRVAVEIYNNFSTFISDNLGINFLAIMKRKLSNLDKEPFELDDCSKVFK